eukprot:scaffold2714_cov123-Isochrysis_galbana.AAC.14
MREPERPFTAAPVAASRPVGCSAAGASGPGPRQRQRVPTELPSCFELEERDCPSSSLLKQRS